MALSLRDTANSGDAASWKGKYFGEGVGIVIAKGNIRLKEVLNYALARVRASGRLEELLLHYFTLAIY